MDNSQYEELLKLSSRPEKPRDQVVRDVASRLQIAPEWIENVIKFESRGDITAKNPLSSAKGLIQFIDRTAQDLGYGSSHELVKKNPTFESQMWNAVVPYFQKHRPQTEEDVYLSVFYPAAKGRGLDTPFPEEVQRSNPGIRTPRDYIDKVRGAATQRQRKPPEPVKLSDDKYQEFLKIVSRKTEPKEEPKEPEQVALPTTEGAEGQQVAGGTTTPPQQLPKQEQAPVQQVAANLPTTEDLRRAGPESFQKQLSPEEYKKQFHGVPLIPQQLPGQEQAPAQPREPLMSETDIGKLIPQKETAPASSTDVALSLDKKGKGKQPTREMILNDPAAIFESTGEDYEPVQSFDDMRAEVRKEYINRGEDIYKKQQWYESVGKEYPAWIDPAKKMSKDDRMALSIYLFDKKIGPASAYVSSTAASSTLNLFPESKAQKEAQAEQPVASTIGNIQGGISSALLVGGLVRNAALGIPWVAQFASAGKAMKAMTAAEKIGRITFDATTRGVAVGGVNLLRRNEDLLSNDPDRIKDALKETAISIGVAMAGAIPETALPRSWIQIPAQLITDFAAQSLGDAILLDRNVFTPEYWKSKENVTNFWTNIGSSIVFSLRDVAKPGAKISAKPSGIEESLDNTVNAISARKAEKETKQVLKALEREFYKAKAMGLDGIHIDGKYYYVSKGFDEISREAIKKEVGKPSTEAAKVLKEKYEAEEAAKKAPPMKPEDLPIPVTTGTKYDHITGKEYPADVLNKAKEAALQKVGGELTEANAKDYDAALRAELEKPEVPKPEAPKPAEKLPEPEPVKPVEAKAKEIAEPEAVKVEETAKPTEAKAEEAAKAETEPEATLTRDAIEDKLSRGESLSKEEWGVLSAKKPGAEPDSDSPQVVLWDLETGEVKKVFPKSAGARPHAAMMNVLSDAERAELKLGKTGMATIDDEGNWKVQTNDAKVDLAKKAVEEGKIVEPAKPVVAEEKIKKAVELTPEEEMKKRVQEAAPVKKEDEYEHFRKIIEEHGARYADAKTETDAKAVETDLAKSIKSEDEYDALLNTVEKNLKKPQETTPDIDIGKMPEAKNERPGFLKRSADDAAKRINERNKGTTLRSGFPVDDMADYAIVGANKINTGLKTFKQWSAAMLKDFGNAVKPILTKVWHEANRYLRKVLTSEAGAIELPFRGKRGIKKTIAEATGLKKTPEVKEELTNLKRLYTSVQRHSKVAYKAGGISERKAAVAQMELNKNNTKNFQEASLKYLKSKNLPREERLSLLLKMQAIKSEKDIARFEKAVASVENKVLHENAESYLKESLAKVKHHKKIRPEYRRVLDEITSQIDQSKMMEKTQRQLLKRKALEGTEVWEQIPDKAKAAIKRLDKTSTKDMSAEELYDVAGQIKTLIAENDLKQKLIIKGKDREYVGVVKEANESINKSVFGRKVGESEGAIPAQKREGLFKKVIGSIGGIEAEKPEFIAEKLGGGRENVIKDVVYGGMDEGTTKYTRRFIDDEAGIKKDFSEASVTQKDLAEMSPTLKNPSISEGDYIKHLQKQAPIELESGEKVGMTGGHKISIYNALKNPHNTKAMLQDGIKFHTNIDKLEPIKLTSNDLNKVVGSMTDKEIAVADILFNRLNNVHSPDLDKEYVRINGVDVTTENYWPMHRVDTYKNVRKGDLKVSDMSDLVMTTIEGSGHLKRRSPRARGSLVIGDAFKDYVSSVDLVAKYTGYAYNIRQAKQLMHDTKKSAYSRGMGKEWRALDNYVNDMSTHYAQPSITGWERGLRIAAGKYTSAALGFNPFVRARQLLSYPAAIIDIDGKNLAKGLVITGGRGKELSDIIEKYSPQTEWRFRTRSANIELGEAATIGQASRVFGFEEKSLASIGTKGISKQDQQAVERVFNAAYEQIKATTDLKPGTEEFKMAVAELGEKATRHSQPMYYIKDRSAVARSASKSLPVRMATMFTSSTNQMLNVYKMSKAGYKASAKKPEDMVKMLKTVGVVWASMTGLSVALDEARDRLGDKKFEVSKTVKRLAISTLFPYYFVKPIASAVFDVVEAFTTSKKKYKSWDDFDASLDDILESGAKNFVGGLVDIGKGVTQDKPIATGDFNRIIRGTEKSLDTFARLRFGVSPASVKRYGYDLPKKQVERFTEPQDKKAVRLALKEVDYEPSFSRFIKVEGEEYVLTMEQRKEVVESTYAAVGRYLDRVNWVAMTKDQKEEYVRKAFRESRDYARDQLRIDKLVKRNPQR